MSATADAAPALVVLAAGASSRLGEPKALARLGDGERETALALLLAAGAALGDQRPLVVAGADHAALAAAAPEGIEVAEHAGWRSGRTGSVRRAAELRPGRDLCVAPVDVPLVPLSVFAALRDEWARRGRPERGWLGPYVERAGARRYGHPVVVGRALAALLKTLPDERPLTELRGLAQPLLGVEVSSASILDDLDDPNDLERLRARRD